LHPSQFCALVTLYGASGIFPLSQAVNEKATNNITTLIFVPFNQRASGGEL